MCGISNAVDGSKESLVRKEIPRDLNHSNNEDNEPEGIYGDGNNADDLDPFSDSDD